MLLVIPCNLCSFITCFHIYHLTWSSELWVMMLFPTWGVWVSERLTDLPKFTQLENSRTGLMPRFSDCWPKVTCMSIFQVVIHRSLNTDPKFKKENHEGCIPNKDIYSPTKSQCNHQDQETNLDTLLSSNLRPHSMMSF